LITAGLLYSLLSHRDRRIATEVDLSLIALGQFQGKKNQQDNNSDFYPLHRLSLRCCFPETDFPRRKTQRINN
jgi:hypothetical protein